MSGTTLSAIRSEMSVTSFSDASMMKSEVSDIKVLERFVESCVNFWRS